MTGNGKDAYMPPVMTAVEFRRPWRLGTRSQQSERWIHIASYRTSFRDRYQQVLLRKQGYCDGIACIFS